MASCYDFCGTPWFHMAPGAFYDLKKVTFGFGKRYLIVTGCGPVTDAVTERLVASLTEPAAAHARTFSNPFGMRNGVYNTLPKTNIDEFPIEYKILDREGWQVTLANAQQLKDEIEAFGADVVVAAGGGKALDLVRTASHFVDSYFRPRIVLCPTMVATNAPATGLSVIYNEDGSGMEDLWNMQLKPDAVLVDTEFVIKAPVRAFVAGIGDQLGTYLEGYYAMIKDYDAWDSINRMVRRYLEINGEIVKEFAVEAVESVKRQEITPAFENIVSNVAFETGPMGQACNGYLTHIMDEVLLEFEPCRRLLHGERVGWAVFPQFCNVGEPEKIGEYVDLYRKIGLPCTLADLGIPDVTYDDLVKAAAHANTKTMARMTYHKFTAEEMAQAVLDAEAAVQAYLAAK